MEEQIYIERKQLYPISVLAKILRVSERTIYNGVAPKAKIKFPIQPRRVNRALRFKGGDILDFINGDNI